MIHCYKDSEINNQKQLVEKAPYNSLIHLIKTRSNYSAVLTKGLPHVLDHNLYLQKKKKASDRRHLFKNQSMNSDFNYEMRSFGNEIPVRSISIDIPFLQSGESSQIVMTYHGTNDITFQQYLRRGSQGNNEPDVVTLHKKLPDVSTERYIHYQSKGPTTIKLSQHEKRIRKGKNFPAKNDCMPGSPVRAPQALETESATAVTDDYDFRLETCLVFDEETPCKKSKLRKLFCCFTTIL